MLLPAQAYSLDLSGSSTRIAAQAAITIALILLGGGFRALVRIAVVALWAFYFLTVRRYGWSRKERTKSLNVVV